MRNGSSELGSIIQLETFLPQNNDEHSCECLDGYPAVYVIPERLPIVSTFSGRIDYLSVHFKLSHQSFSASTNSLVKPRMIHNASSFLVTPAACGMNVTATYPYAGVVVPVITLSAGACYPTG